MKNTEKKNTPERATASEQINAVVGSNFNYIEVRQYETEDVVKRMDVTGKNERMVDRIQAGLDRIMNHEDYYSIVVESDLELPII